ncbi:MAG: type II secretion system major pseudopilin GspG [Spirochaetes bacterium]|nr:type II secretion system major pseudopilin GspG [Spirochaetota bacterium]MBU0954117.1 type II secretion system major pseudopilin GspG [Spirochaetota bacterium]
MLREGVVNTNKQRKLAVRSARRLDGGWTFIETLVVLGIVLILTATVGFTAMKQLAKAKTVAARSQIDSLQLAMQSYYLDTGSHPTREQGLMALREKPTLSPVPNNWDGPYMEKPIPDDPWGRPYVYLIPGPAGMPYGLASYGKDGVEGGEGEDADTLSW